VIAPVFSLWLTLIDAATIDAGARGPLVHKSHTLDPIVATREQSRGTSPGRQVRRIWWALPALSRSLRTALQICRTRENLSGAPRNLPSAMRKAAARRAKTAARESLVSSARLFCWSCRGYDGGKLGEGIAASPRAFVFRSALNPAWSGQDVGPGRCAGDNQ